MLRLCLKRCFPVAFNMHLYVILTNVMNVHLELPRSKSHLPRLEVVLAPKGKGEARPSGSPCHSSFMGCITKRLLERQSVSTSIWANARTRSVLENMCAACLGVTRTTLRQNMRANENKLTEDPKGTLRNALRQTMSLRRQLMMEQRVILAGFLLKAVSALNCFAVQLASLRVSGHYSLIVLALITK